MKRIGIILACVAIPLSALASGLWQHEMSVVVPQAKATNSATMLLPDGWIESVTLDLSGTSSGAVQVALNAVETSIADVVLLTNGACTADMTVYPAKYATTTAGVNTESTGATTNLYPIGRVPVFGGQKATLRVVNTETNITARTWRVLILVERGE